MNDDIKKYSTKDILTELLMREINNAPTEKRVDIRTIPKKVRPLLSDEEKKARSKASFNKWLSNNREKYNEYQKESGKQRYADRKQFKKELEKEANTEQE
jgi:hypothetical protein